MYQFWSQSSFSHGIFQSQMMSFRSWNVLNLFVWSSATSGNCQGFKTSLYFSSFMWWLAPVSITSSSVILNLLLILQTYSQPYLLLTYPIIFDDMELRVWAINLIEHPNEILAPQLQRYFLFQLCFFNTTVYLVFK